MRVLAEMGLLLVLGLVVGLRSDGVFIAGLLLAVSSPDWWNGCVPRNGLGSCVRRISSSPWRCFMVRVHAAHRLRYCTAAGPRLDRSPGWGTDCGKWPLPQCLADRGLSPFPCRCNAFGPVAFGRRALDMGVAADRALVRPWHRPSPDAGDDAGRPAWIRSGPARASSDERGARCCTRRTGARILAGHSFAHRRHR